MEGFDLDNNWHYEVGSGEPHPSEYITRVKVLPPTSSKKSITSAEFMQLAGLFALAQKHEAMLQDIIQSALSITGEYGPGGHTTDAMHAYGPDMMDLLNKLGLKIED